MAALKHDHRITELEDDLEFSGVDQVIAVQSRRSEKENHFLLEQARESEGVVAGVVGWAPLASGELRVFLDQYLREPLFKGVRETICDPIIESPLDNPDFDEGVHELTRLGLCFELMVSPEALPAAISFADRHPDQQIVLDHCGCPELTAGAFPKAWAHAMRELARRPHVYCKISGLTMPMSPHPGNTPHEAMSHSQLIKPCFETVCDAFGPIRLMFGSNWPVCNLTTNYPAWLTTVDDLVFALSRDEQEAIYRDTAVGFFQL